MPRVQSWPPVGRSLVKKGRREQVLCLQKRQDNSELRHVYSPAGEGANKLCMISCKVFNTHLQIAPQAPELTEP